MSRDSSSVLMSAYGLRKIFHRKGALPIEVLSGVELDVYPGDSIAIIGKSGAGKSTLLHILGTLEKPSEGNVLFYGQDIFRFNEQSLSVFRNRQIGFVFQFHYLMQEFTALENVMMPALISGQLRKDAMASAGGLLETVGLEHRMQHKPNQLSGGEQQRVAIARALMMNPKLLFTDEMTGNLDPLTGRSIFELIHALHKEFGMAIISVTHDEVLAAAYSRRFRLEAGQLVKV